MTMPQTDITLAPSVLAPAPVAQIPPSIVGAIAKIKATLGVIKRSGQHPDGFSFATVDDLYEAVNRLMGEAGLILLALEDQQTITAHQMPDSTIQNWVEVRFQFVFATEAATWSDPRAARTISYRLEGPQSFQAAQSFAEKQFLKSLFKIATGDLDLDAAKKAAFGGESKAAATHPQSAQRRPEPVRSPVALLEPPAPPPPPPAPPADEAEPSGDFDVELFLDSLALKLAATTTEEEMAAVYEKAEQDSDGKLSRAERQRAADIHGEHLRRMASAQKRPEVPVLAQAND